MAEQNFELIKIISQNKDGRKIQKRVHDCDGKAETQPIFERHTENDKKADEYTDEVNDFPVTRFQHVACQILIVFGIRDFIFPESGKLSEFGDFILPFPVFKVS